MIWSSDFAYVVGLLTTDGNLSKDGRHLDLTSKDLDQILTFESILKTNNKIGVKSSPSHQGRKYYRIQFSNVKLYRFLVEIGLKPNKSKLLGKLDIPPQFFADFLRGHLDGDGYTCSYWDKRWKSSFMLYTGFISASREHLLWIQSEINNLYKISGSIKYNGGSTYQLMYAKKSSCQLLKKLYYKEDLPCLQRKLSKINKALGIISQQHAGMAKW